MWSALQARLCSDALQEARRAEHERKLRERKLREQVRPDFVVCSASVTVRRDYFAASQKLRREQQERDAAWAANRPDLWPKLLGRRA